jgi:RNA polymerase sigma-70 factor (ECF subfamily)
VTAPTDETLLREYLDGKTASFELLVRRHAPELHQFVLRFTGNSMAAEDVVQETFLQVHNAAESFDLSRRFKPWLFTIGANKARDHLRKVSRRREVSFDANVGGGDESGQRFIDLLAGEDVLPHDEMQQEERRRFVRGIMESVPAKLSEVLILAYFHRFAYKEIAEIVGIPLGTVKSRLHAAIACFGERYRDAIAQRIGDDE